MCTLINKCQSKEFSAADAVNLWLDMKLPEEFDEILAARKKKAISVYALTAYYLHPEYDNNKLSNQQTDEINTFLFKHLNADGLEEWDNFSERKSFFNTLYETNTKKKPMVFWNLAEMKQPILSKLAKKLHPPKLKDYFQVGHMCIH